MAADVGGLVADIGLNVAGLRADIKQSNRELSRGTNRMNRHLGSMRKKVDSVTRGFKGLAVVLAAGMLIRHTQQTIDAADNMLKLTQRIGGTTEAMSELEFVADRSGIAFNTLTMGLQRMVRRVAEAAEGTGEAKAALKELNLDARKLRELALDQQFEKIADALSGVESESDRVRLAMKLFDSEGVALLQTMTNGAQGIRDLRSEGRKLGVTLTQDMAERARDAKDATTNLSAAWSSLARNLEFSALPIISTIARDLADIGSRMFAPTLEFDIRDTSDRITKLQQQIDRIKSDDKPGGARLLEGLSESLADANAELDTLLFKQGKLLDRPAKTNIPSGLLGGVDPEELEKIRASYAKTFETAEQELARSLSEFSLVEHLFPDDERERIKAAFHTIYTSGIDEIKVTSKKRIPEVFNSSFQNLTQQLGRSLGRTLHNQFSDAFMGIETSFGDMLKRMAADFASSGLLRALASMIPGPFGLAIGSLAGFASGGSFQVGGSGGTDSQLVAFKASPDETVSITKPGQSGSGSSPTVVRQEFNFPIAFPTQLESFVRNVAGPAGREAALQVLNARQGRF